MAEIKGPVEQGNDETTINSADAGGGLLKQTLYRANKQIKRDRADAIEDDLEITYRRLIEDKKNELRRLIRQQQNMLDLSPDNTQTLLLAKDLDAPLFVKTDLDLGIKMRQLEIEIDISTKRYTILFNKSI